MTKEKLVSLYKYLNDLTNRLSSKVIPEKHKNRVKEYHNHLKHEISLVTGKIEKDKLGL